MHKRRQSVNASRPSQSPQRPELDQVLVEEVAQEEAWRERQNWFGMPGERKQFYLDRVTRIIGSYRDKARQRR